MATLTHFCENVPTGNAEIHNVAATTASLNRLCKWIVLEHCDGISPGSQVTRALTLPLPAGKARANDNGEVLTKRSLCTAAPIIIGFTRQRSFF